MHIPQLSLKRVIRIFFLKLQTLDMWPGSFRHHLLRLGGVKIGKYSHVWGGTFLIHCAQI